jgi:outer membrane protein TolC
MSARHSLFVKSLILIIAAASLAGCVTTAAIDKRVAPSPKEPWTPPPTAPPSGGIPASAPPAAPAPQIPPELQASRGSLTLAQLVDIGLGSNAQTRLAWSAARSAAAALSAAQSPYFPKVDVTTNAARQKAAFAGGKFIVDQQTLTPAATLSWLLLDFGGRKAGAEAARQALQAANWTQSSVIQNVILQVEKSYYQYVAAKALLKAQTVSMKGAQANYEAAKARRDAGVATIADVLQAKTALSSSELNLVSAQGLVRTLHGTLANALGLAANADFEVADEMAETAPLQEISEKVDACIQEAEMRRPDLAAARALAERAQAQARKAKSDLMPTFTLNSSYGRIYYSNQPVTNEQFGLAILLSVPVFAGGLREAQLLQAKADAETAGAQADKLAQDVALQVWTSYYGVTTSEQKIKAARDLLASAEQSLEVARGRYKEGVGSILDLLTAQSMLENARGQTIQAQTEWYLSLVQLTRDLGTLAAPGPVANPGL